MTLDPHGSECHRAERLTRHGRDTFHTGQGFQPIGNFSEESATPVFVITVIGQPNLKEELAAGPKAQVLSARCLKASQEEPSPHHEKH